MDLMALVESKREEILALAAEHGAHSVRVFGSAARGDAYEQSDIDFIVEFAPGTSLLRHAELIVALEDLLGRKVDVATENALKERIRDRALAEAVRL